MIERLKAAWSAFKNPEVVETKDDLTECLTRRKFKCLAEREIFKAKRGEKLSCVYVDLDNLKEINDTKGHKTGDVYLQSFAQATKKNIRAYDLFARMGGDEFVIILIGINEEEAEKIVKRIHKIFPYFSWGISLWCDGYSLEELIEKADTKMYQQKKNKRNQAGDYNV